MIYSVVDLISGQDQLRSTLQGYVNDQLGIGAGAAIAGRLEEFTTKASIQTLGVIGFAALLVSVVSLLWNIESAFNHIYAVRKPRAPVRRLLTYWAFLTLGPFLLAGSVTASWKISQMQASHAQRLIHPHSEVLHALAALSSIAITYASLAFLYKLLPNARVRLRSALAAAFAAGSAWELAKFIFAWASSRMVQVHKIYGSVAVLPIVLTWIYISWIIALIGCRLCYALDASRRPDPHPGLHGVVARETFVARTMIAVAEQHRTLGAPVHAVRIAADLDASPRMVREALRALRVAGLLVEARHGGFLPERDLAQIDFAQLRSAARASIRFPRREGDAVDLAIRTLWEQADGAARGALTETLAAFLARTRVSAALAPADAAPAASPAPSPLAAAPGGRASS